MLDAKLKPAIDILLILPARGLSRLGVSANVITLIGAGIGLLAFIMVCLGYFWAALICICLNRLADGMDGAVAREVGRPIWADIWISSLIFYSIHLSHWALPLLMRHMPR
jgi:hypothetical protein